MAFFCDQQANACLHAAVQGAKEGRFAFSASEATDDHRAIVRRLLREKCDAEVPNMERQSAWDFALQRRCPHIRRCLRPSHSDQDIDVELPIEKNNCSGLNTAHHGGVEDIVRLLTTRKIEDLQKEVDREIGNSVTWLMFAARCNKSMLVSAALEANADINARSRTGCTALSMAAESGALECVDLLLAAKAAVDMAGSHGWTPLMLACENGFDITVAKLLSSKVSSRGRAAQSSGERGGLGLSVRWVVSEQSSVASPPSCAGSRVMLTPPPHDPAH